MLATWWWMLGGCVEYGITTLDGQDVFTQLPATELDVVLVVDNSCSMQPYQDELAQNFDNFLTFFEEGDVDYHIGVITTSVWPVEPYAGCPANVVDRIPAGGELVAGEFITPDTENGADLFGQLVNVGVCGNGSEMGLESADRALHGGLGDDFLRDDAFLSVIFVSDEEDGSPMPVNDYINSFREVKGPRASDSFNASALVVTDLELCNRQQVNSGGTPGTRYIDVANQTVGILGSSRHASVCGHRRSARNSPAPASSRLSDRFYLSEKPNVSSLVVIIDEVETPCDVGGWTYQEVEYEGIPDQPAIVFEREFMPPPYTEIVVQYNRGGGGDHTCGGGE